MQQLWGKDDGSRKFYGRGLTLYPEEVLYREMAFLAYYFHWASGDVLRLDHRSRRRWCMEISEIHKHLNDTQSEREKSILDMRPDRDYRR